MRAASSIPFRPGMSISSSASSAVWVSSQSSAAKGLENESASLISGRLPHSLVTWSARSFSSSTQIAVMLFPLFLSPE